MIASAAALALIGLILLWLAGCLQCEAGLPSGRVVSIDPGRLERAPPVLVDAALGLSGRPDFLLRVRGRHVPVEAKHTAAPVGGHPGHVLQLAAYCRLVHATQGRRPPYGVLRYADRALAIRYTRSLESKLLQTLRAIGESTGTLPDRSHESPARCRGCAYRSICDRQADGAPAAAPARV